MGSGPETRFIKIGILWLNVDHILAVKQYRTARPDEPPRCHVIMTYESPKLPELVFIGEDAERLIEFLQSRDLSASTRSEVNGNIMA